MPVLRLTTGAEFDTTLFGISSGVWLFAKHPEEWDNVRGIALSIPNAISEILLRGPIQGFLAMSLR